jgi:hypothetical protein
MDIIIRTKDLVRNMIALEERREVRGELRDILDDWGRERLGYPVRGILSWLESRAGVTDKGPLCWEPQYVWATDIRSLVERVPTLGLVFRIEGNRLDYRDEISLEAQEQIEQFAFRADRPRVWITIRPDE